MTMRRQIAVVVFCALMVSLSGNSLAGIVGTTGDVSDVSITPPTSVVQDATTSNTDIFLFPEASQLILPAPISVDVSVPGTYIFAASAPYTPGVIPAGTTVDSYFLNFDLLTNGVNTGAGGSVIFNCPVIGIIALTASLDASDAVLGRVGTMYPTGTAPKRGLDIEESVILSADRLEVTVNLEIQPITRVDGADASFDQVRVITQCPPLGTCPRTQGYWKNHEEAWPVTSLTLGSQVYSQAELLAILRTPPRGDASLILAHQLIAAKLNIANGSDPASIGVTILSADALLSGFVGKLPYGVAASSTTGQAMVGDAKTLDKYNNGVFTPECGDQ